MQLDFKNLFEQALAAWPEQFDLSMLERAAPDLNRYAVKGLGRLSDEIGDRYIGTDSEVITRTLQGAIYSVIHATAKTVLKLELLSIRPEAVRLVFEKKLKETAASTDLNWRPEDYALAEAYFVQNSSSETP
jgi:hypothetical protein